MAARSGRSRPTLTSRRCTPSGTIGVEDADILISLKANHAPTANYVKKMREQLPRLFPGTSFAFLPADMVSQILNFGVPAPIDLQVVGNDVQADRRYANALLSRIKHIPGVADARIQQAFQQPTLNVNVDRSLAGLVGLSEKDAATAMLTTLAGSSQTSPTYWLNPQTGVSLCSLDPATPGARMQRCSRVSC
jgi:Cu/Ag efflux pump CusA